MGEPLNPSEHDQISIDATAWPFEWILRDRWERLTELQKGRVEAAALEKLREIEADARARGDHLRLVPGTRKKRGRQQVWSEPRTPLRLVWSSPA